MNKILWISFVAAALTNSTHAEWMQWTVAAGGNGHYYQAVLAPNSIDWFSAKAEAESRGGYLATITSAEENTFVHNLIATSAFWINVGVDCRGPWLGAYQPSGSPEPSGGWTWVTGEPFVYQNWAVSASSDGQQPKDNPAGENYLHFLGAGNNNYAATWNDLLPNGGPRGYIVESVPEPSTSLLLGAALTTWGIRHRRKA